MAKKNKQLNQTRLTDSDIRGIRLAGLGGMNQQAIAEIYKVTQEYISMILAGKRRPGIYPKVEQNQ
jgi:transcriptional regulator